VHAREDTCTGAVTFSVNVFVTPPAVAVSTGVWFDATMFTVAVKFALVVPAATVTGVGTVTLPLLLDMVTETPPAGAAPLNERVHAEDPGAVTVAGEHVKPLKAPGESTVTEPPVPAG
jgi:hypothetical protein